MSWWNETKKQIEKISGKKEIKLMEKNQNNVVSFKITADSEKAKKYITQLTDLGEFFKAKVEISGKIVTLKCLNSDIADIIREIFVNRE